VKSRPIFIKMNGLN